MIKKFTRSVLSFVLFSSIGIMDSNAQLSPDASITFIQKPVCAHVLFASLTNKGNDDIKTVQIGWSVNGIYQTPNSYTKNLVPDTLVSYQLLPNYNFINGNTYTVKVFTYNPNNTNDVDVLNDTSQVTFKYAVQKPYGAAFIKGTPFESPSPNTTGTKTDPDLVIFGNKLTYELSPPTGFSNSNYGTTWYGAAPVVKSFNGINISKSYWNYTNPSGSVPGKLTFSPDISLRDTCIIVRLQIVNISGNFCDSTIFRHICVVSPVSIDFKFGEKNTDGISIYPNPTKDVLNLISKNSTIGNIIVYSATGQVIYRQNPQTAMASINTSEWTNGVYTFNITGDGKTNNIRVIIQH